MQAPTTWRKHLLQYALQRPWYIHELGVCPWSRFVVLSQKPVTALNHILKGSIASSPIAHSTNCLILSLPSMKLRSFENYLQILAKVESSKVVIKKLNGLRRRTAVRKVCGWRQVIRHGATCKSRAPVVRVLNCTWRILGILKRLFHSNFGSQLFARKSTNLETRVVRIS